MEPLDPARYVRKADWSPDHDVSEFDERCERHARWQQTSFAEDADAEYAEQIIPPATADPTEPKTSWT